MPVALGSDTNGSIRVPASLCGLWGLRPGDNVIPLDGVFPFVEPLDTAGPFTRTAQDLDLVFRVLSGTPKGGAYAQPQTLRVARLGGYFQKNASPEAVAAVDRALSYFGDCETIDIVGAEAARSAAFLLSAAEGGAFHLPELSRHAVDYDPAVRDRLLAGALLPAGAYIKAKRFQDTFKREVASVFERFDVIVAPATPVHAPLISDPTVLIGGKPTPARANLGIYTQPLSLAGMPVAAAPVRSVRPDRGKLPLGVQIAMPWGQERTLLALLCQMEGAGYLGYSAPGATFGEAAKCY